MQEEDNLKKKREVTNYLFPFEERTNIFSVSQLSQDKVSKLQSLISGFLRHPLSAVTTGSSQVPRGGGGGGGSRGGNRGIASTGGTFKLGGSTNASSVKVSSVVRPINQPAFKHRSSSRTPSKLPLSATTNATKITTSSI